MTLKEYPAQLSLTTLICMMGALQGTIVTLVIEKAKSGIWSMHNETEIVATLYSVRNHSLVFFNLHNHYLKLYLNMTYDYRESFDLEQATMFRG